MIAKPEISALLPDEDELAARGEALVAELMGESAANPGPGRSRRRRPFRLLLGLVAIPLIGVGAAAAAGVFSADEMAVEGGIGCYSAVSLKPEAIAIIGPREDPVAACAKIWREGALSHDDPASAPKGVPPLTACTGEDEPVRVMPAAGERVCERLGLVALPSDYPAASQAWERLQQALDLLRPVRVLASPSGDGEGCRTPQEVIEEARGRLDRAGVSDVPITPKGGLPCAGTFMVEDRGLSLYTATLEHVAQRRQARAGAVRDR